MTGERITVSGQVQGVGFRPAVWRLAQELGLTGDVRNTGEGVEIRIFGAGIDAFAERLLDETPVLARVDRLLRVATQEQAPEGFAILPSVTGEALQASVAPDAACCPACLAETADPFARRFRYPFANCTECGPRFSIIEGAPYDRERTTMRDFALCADCAAEYTDPGDRRFHAQPIACHACGPRAWLERLGGGAVSYDAFSMLDAVDAAGGMLNKGHIVAIKGIGGFHLACDASDLALVAELRRRKRRQAKAFALMARDMAVIRRYCLVDAAEVALLQGPAAPIVLLRATASLDGVAPRLGRLGFMLPATPMHHLLMRRVGRPVVMTSGNVSGQPQCISNDDARVRLAGIAEFALMHDRGIANRLDDSVLRVDLGRVRVLRRGRGLAPAPVKLPPGFKTTDAILAMGADMKNAFCLVHHGQAILSQHLGELEDVFAEEEASRTLERYEALYQHGPAAIAVDRHPAYASARAGRALAERRSLPLLEIQHHHAHAAACMAENALPLDGPPVLGIVMDGTGFGEDGTVWGGEFLLCTYREATRLACLKPVALPGAAQAVREPWRNAYAHLMAEMGWPELAMNFSDLPVFARLAALPRPTLDAMIAGRVNTPLASSCGRLFDAAAALCGLAWLAQDHEGQAAMAFEAAIDPAALKEPDDLAYPFAIPLLNGRGLPYIEPLGAWRALLGDLHLQTPVGTIAARFHRGLARAIVAMADQLHHSGRGASAVALSGGCFQNATLFQLVHDGLQAAGLTVLTHAQIPANDGGLAFGQAVIAAAQRQEPAPCA